VSGVISGLSPGATYHYRLVATNPSYTVDGQDRTFTTMKIPLSFKLSTRLGRNVAGRPFSVTGTLSGTGSAAHMVQLQANPFPYLGGFKALGSPRATDANGNFAFTVAGLSKNTQLRVATLDTPSVASPVFVALVAVRVTLHVRSTGRPGFVRLYGMVTPAEVGAQVGLQLLGPKGRPVNVGDTLIKRGKAGVSRFSRVLRIRRAGLYRASVYVVSGAQVPNHSRAIRIR